MAQIGNLIVTGKANILGAFSADTITSNKFITSGGTVNQLVQGDGNLRGIVNNTSKTHLNWSSAATSITIPTMNTLAYWNGGYNSTTSNITMLGIVDVGTWNATTISVNKGGTGLTSYEKGDILYASSKSALSKLTIGSNGKFLQVVSGLPSWVSLTYNMINGRIVNYNDLGEKPFTKDQGTSMYNWYVGITAADTDNTINKWNEIVTFLNGISNASGQPDLKEILLAKQNKVAKLGSTTQPLYTSADGTFATCSTYAGGTLLTLNGTAKGGQSATIYAPTSNASASGYVLISLKDSAPIWALSTTLTVGKLNITDNSENASKYLTFVSGSGELQLLRNSNIACNPSEGKLIVKKILISSTTAADHLQFSRKKTDSDMQGLNYILFPTEGYLAFAKSAAENSIVGLFEFSTDSNNVITRTFRPAKTGNGTIGTSDYRWAYIYGNKLDIKLESTFAGTINSSGTINSTGTTNLSNTNVSGTTNLNNTAKLNKNTYVNGLLIIQNLPSSNSNIYFGGVKEGFEGKYKYEGINLTWGVIQIVSPKKAITYTDDTRTTESSTTYKYKSYFLFYQYSCKSDEIARITYYEAYKLPDTNTDLTTSLFYDILTSKPTYSIMKSLTLNTTWQDVGVSGTNLSNGIYIVYMYRANNMYYSGIMSWYSGSISTAQSDEIVLHGNGNLSNSRLYLRTTNDASSTTKLLISANKSLAAANVTFKFLKIM